MMLGHIVHSVAQPGETGSQAALCLLYVHLAFFTRKRLYVVICPGMGERLVNEIKANTPGGVVTINGLQTGNLTQEGRSGQATEHQHRIIFVNTAQMKIIAVSIKDRDVRKPLTDFRQYPGELSTRLLTRRY